MDSFSLIAASTKSFGRKKSLSGSRWKVLYDDETVLAASSAREREREGIGLADACAYGLGVPDTLIDLPSISLDVRPTRMAL
jgi:hypothetical protein